MTLFGWTGSPDPAELLNPAQLLAHRGPSVLGRTLGGANVDSDDAIELAWSGTIRGQLPSVETYRREGTRFAEELDGEFVLAIRDGQTLHLVRDAAGGRTAYYGRIGDHWLAANEPKAIWSNKQFHKRLRPAAVAQYFSFSFIPGAGTMLDDLYEVPAGHRVELQSGCEPKVVRYFDPLDVESCDPDPSVWGQRFRSLLEQEVAARLEHNTPPTIFLSGGLDSSIVTAEVARQSSEPVRTFAIHFGRKYSNELDFARMVADGCGTRHEEVEIKPKAAVSEFQRMVWHLDEPVGDPVTMPNFSLAAHAAEQGITHVFNGEGGDPLFGGPKNIPMLLGHWYGGPGPQPGERERRYLASYRRAYEELDALFSPSLREQIDLQRDLEAILTPFFERDGSLLHKLLAINTTQKGAHLILPKVERMLAASNVTPLSPMFTRSMIELAFASPPKAKLQNGCEKWLMKQAYAGLIPDEIIARPKSGMRVPVHYWFKGPLRRYARKILSRRELERVGLFNPDRVRQWLRYDIGQANGRYGLRIWMLITFELWRRMVFEDVE